jgi:hypothetical protein
MAAIVKSFNFVTAVLNRSLSNQSQDTPGRAP